MKKLNKVIFIIGITTATISSIANAGTRSISCKADKSWTKECKAIGGSCSMLEEKKGLITHTVQLICTGPHKSETARALKFIGKSAKLKPGCMFDQERVVGQFQLDPKAELFEGATMGTVGMYCIR